jgi:fructan beta-fructosidase
MARMRVLNLIGWVVLLAALSLYEVPAKSQTIGYDQPYRPQVHFSPREHWTNDPNGLVYFHGEYHLFYQYNPFGDQWGHMSWGHAISTDLLHWHELPVAIYTGSGDTAQGRRQTQNLAYSMDNGRTWRRYAANPVLDLQMADFRDPSVSWDEKERH